LDLKQIKQVIDLMKRSDLTAFELEEEGFKIKIKRGADAGVDLKLFVESAYSPEPAQAASTCSAPWPVMTTVWRDAASPTRATASSTCCNRLRPAIVCSTFGRALFMRVPLPAAMITTFKPMPDSRIRWWKLLIIGSVLLVAAGCSALRVAYSNGPTLAWWQLDGWVDADRSQAPAVRAAIDRWFAWHRSTQLAPTAALLAEARAQVMQPVTPEALCRFNERVQTLTQPAIGRALEEAADLLPLLTEAIAPYAGTDTGRAIVVEFEEQDGRLVPVRR
jgi:hypothetical protein